MSSLDQNYLRVAKCGRVVGLKGEIALWPISNIEQRFVIGSDFYLEDETQLSVENIRPHKDHFIVKFEGFEDREVAESLVNKILFAQPITDEVLDEGEYFHHDLIGKSIFDQNEISRGRVESVIESAASDLMQTDDGALVPLRFIKEIKKDMIFVDTPEGLFDIYDEKK